MKKGEVQTSGVSQGKMSTAKKVGIAGAVIGGGTLLVASGVLGGVIATYGGPILAGLGEFFTGIIPSVAMIGLPLWTYIIPAVVAAISLTVSLVFAIKKLIPFVKNIRKERAMAKDLSSKLKDNVDKKKAINLAKDISKSKFVEQLIKAKMLPKDITTDLTSEKLNEIDARLQEVLKNVRKGSEKEARLNALIKDVAELKGYLTVAPAPAAAPEVVTPAVDPAAPAVAAPAPAVEQTKAKEDLTPVADVDKLLADLNAPEGQQVPPAVPSPVAGAQMQQAQVGSAVPGEVPQQATAVPSTPNPLADVYEAAAKRKQEADDILAANDKFLREATPIAEPKIAPYIQQLPAQQAIVMPAVAPQQATAVPVAQPQQATAVPVAQPQQATAVLAPVLPVAPDPLADVYEAAAKRREEAEAIRRSNDKIFSSDATSQGPSLSVLL